MGIFRDIITAIRGGANEVGEAVVDSQAIRILEQEMRDAENGIQKAKKSLSGLKAKEIDLQRQLTVVNDDIKDYEDKARAALSKDNRELAIKIAKKLSELKVNQKELAGQQSALESQVDKIYAVIKKREQQLEENKLEVQKAKTYEDLQKTQKAVVAAMPTNDSSSQRVNRAMKRVKQKQRDAENGMEADEWLAELESDGDLDAEIKKAGIGEIDQSAEDILASLESPDNSSDSSGSASFDD